MAINKAEWAEIESKIARVDQAGIIEKQIKFENNTLKKLDTAMKDIRRQVNDKIDEIDEEAKKREALLKKDRFSSTLHSVLNVLDHHGCKYDDSYIIRYILKYTSEYCEMQEQKESYTDWCKTREQGLSERAAKKSNNMTWDADECLRRLEWIREKH